MEGKTKLSVQIFLPKQKILSYNESILKIFPKLFVVKIKISTLDKYLVLINNCQTEAIHSLKPD